MRVGWRLVLGCLACGALAVGWCVSAAASTAEGTSATTSEFGDATLTAPMTSPAGELFDQGGVGAAEEARRLSPEVVAEREASRTRYERLDSESASKLVAEVFPSMVDEPDGGAPRMPTGQRITGFDNAYAAQVDLGGGKRGVIASMAPMAIQTSKGWAPVDLGLHDTGDSFEAANPLVTARLPRRLSEGAQMSELGLSVTPVDGHGSPLGGSEGAIDGAGVFFANTETDSDTFLKPTTFGLSIETMLRSVRSPELLFFRVGLPAGASLVAAGDGSERALIVREGVTIAEVPMPSAQDAAGSDVPLTMSVSSDVITVRVDRSLGEYRLPVEVDPEVRYINVDRQMLSSSSWLFNASQKDHFYQEKVKDESSQHLIQFSRSWSLEAGEWMDDEYETQGESQIYEFEGYVIEDVERGRSLLQFSHEGTVESTDTVGERIYYNIYGSPRLETLCANQGESPCSPSAGHEHNRVWYKQIELEPEEYQDALYSDLSNAKVWVSQEKGPEESFNTASSTVDGGRENVMYGSGGWLSPSKGAIEVKVHDPGVGVGKYNIGEIGGAGWSMAVRPSEEGKCAGIQCPENEAASFTYNSDISDGEYSIILKAEDTVGLSSWIERKIKVDGTPPHNIEVSGFQNGDELGTGETGLKIKATDGEGSTPSSGVKSITVTVDGQPLAQASGDATPSCEPGPCTAGGEWPIAARNYAPGDHTLIVTATDNAGNVAREEFKFVVRAAAPVSVGPGSVNPESGELTLSTTDVSMGDGLQIGRSYASQHLVAGAAGPFGPQWLSNLGTAEYLTVEDGSVVLTSASGAQTSFRRTEEGQFESPVGDGNLKVEAKESGGKISEYVLTDTSSGTTTSFRLPPGSSGPWMPSGSQTYTYETVEVEDKDVVEPAMELAPKPAGVECGETVEDLVPGCRALTFTYAHETTAEGESESEWGEYKGRLMKVSFTAYNPSSKKMQTTPVAQYQYDHQGRLRAEWDPRISPALKTTYGYDPEGHVTTISPPGEEPWVFTYGTIAGDGNQGRLLKVMRPTAGTGLWGGEAVKNTETPKITGSPVVGVRLAVSNGKWSGSPLTYGYQWEDCNSQGEACTPILGATNANYTLGSGDAGHTVVAEVTATNGGGSEVASSATSTKVEESEPSTEYSLPGASGPSDITAGPDGNLWFTDTKASRIGKITTSGTVTEYALPEESEPSGITAGPDGNLWFTESATGRIGKITTSGTITEYVLSYNSIPRGIVAGPDGNLWFTENKASRIGKITTSGTVTEYALPMYSKPMGISVGPDGNLWFTDSATSKIGEITTSGTVTEYALPEGSGPYGITAGPDGDLWFTDSETSKIGKITTSGTVTEYALAAGSLPAEITTDPGGSLWFTEEQPNTVGKITTSGTVSEYHVSTGSEPFGITAGPEGNLWLTEHATSKVGMITLKPTEGEARPAGPGSTIEYGVPISGGDAPYDLSEAEVVKWGQKDDPAEGMAVIPPDEPQGWPASSYKRATIHYIDSEGRAVNTATPGGGIATSEYNEDDDVVRALSADNREKALEAGATSAEVAEHLDTQSKYGEEGTELLETTGPEHEVELANKEVKHARNRVRYYYDEGAPADKKYGLVTKTTDGALLPGGSEVDVRTTETSYNGQEGLGWELRKPTSVKKDPLNLNLTTEIVYNPTTGAVEETRPPGGAKESTALTFSLQFGSKGSGDGQFDEPAGIAVDSKGNVWIADAENDRVEEFNGKGEYLQQFGSEGSGNGQFEYPTGIAVDSKGDVWIADTGNDRVEEFNGKGEYLQQFGSEGSGNGQFQYPESIAIGSNGNVWVADTGNGRVEEFNEKGEYLQQFGSWGSGDGQFEDPAGIVVDGKGDVWVTDEGNSRIEEFNEKGEYLQQFGSEGSGNGQLQWPVGIAVDAKGNVWVADRCNGRVEEFNEKGEYLQQFGSEGSGDGQFKYPEGIAVGSKGSVWVTDSKNNRVEEWATGEEGKEESKADDNPEVHDSRIVYYTPGTEAGVTACENHPEWAGLTCETGPAAQPEDGTPDLPVTTTTYDIWDEPEVTVEVFGSTTRTKTITYDEAGRILTSEETSTADHALPKVTDHYSETTGALIKQSTEVEGEEQSLTSTYNRLGQLTSYTDASGNTTTYEYEAEGDARLTHVDDGKGTQTYSYDSTTGEMTGLEDSAAGDFTAAYDVEGKMTSETYPNGMCANDTYNSVGEATHIEYIKTADCSEKAAPVWFSETLTPGIHGETLSAESTLAKESYAYDSVGRLTEVQETPAGKGCTTRLYAYDEESNRTSQTTREPETGGACATEGGGTEAHSYDSANHLTDEGVGYDAFGNTTVLPASDAGGHELRSTYYVDGQVESQTQNEQTNAYELDPEGRVMKTTASGREANGMTINHYAGPGEAVAWTSRAGSEEWTRNIPGIDGTLSAVQTNGGTPVLQLRDLHGNIVATASESGAETKLLSTYQSTVFGVPSTGSPPKFSWLGASGVSSGLPTTGIITTGTGSYVPEIGRELQTETVTPLGACPSGCSSGAGYVATTSPWSIKLSEEQSASVIAEWAVIKAAKEAAARAQAEHEAEIARLIAEESTPPNEGGVAAAEEEGPYTEDPSWLLTAAEAKILTYALRYGGTLVGVLWPEAGVFIEALEVIGGDVINEASEKLEKCYQPLYEAKLTGDARCKAFVNLYDGFIPVSWGVELCWKREYKRKNSVHITYPYCDPT